MTPPVLPRDMLARCAAHFPRRVAYSCGARSSSWAEMHARSSRLANGLRGLGVGKGDSVAYLGLESIEIYEHFFACMQLGAVRVCLNARYAPAELLHVIRDSDAKVLLLDEKGEAVLDPVRREIASAGLTLVGVGAAATTPLRYETLLRAAATEMAGSIAPQDPLLYAYTSGTTGTPKGVIHTHAGIRAMILQSVISRGLTGDDVWSTAAASSWITAVLNLQGLANGMSHVLLDGTFEIRSFLRDVQRRRATAVMLVPTLIRRLLKELALGRYDLSSLRLLMYGSEPAPAPLIAEAAGVLGCGLLQSYGLTEAGWVAQLSPADHRHALANAPAELRSVGRVCNGIDVSVRDPDGNAVAAGAPGDIWLRGETVMAGYLNLPEQTADAMRGGWFRTNDVGYIDDDGRLYLVDRRHSIIATGAVKVFPSAVEAVLGAHPAVEEVAVVGTPHPDWGQAVVAVLRLKQGANVVTAGDLRAFCGPRLSKPECPKHVLFIDDFPRTANGKVHRKQLEAWVEERRTMLPW